MYSDVILYDDGLLRIMFWYQAQSFFIHRYNYLNNATETVEIPEKAFQKLVTLINEAKS